MAESSAARQSSEGPQPSDPTLNLLREISTPGAQPRAVAVAYWFALREDPARTDWVAVNRAIVERWSLEGLEQIKTMALSGSCLEAP